MNKTTNLQPQPIEIPKGLLVKENEFIFVDLFSGIGAFHEAISQVFPNSSCQYALDIDQNKNEIYQLLHDYPKKNILEGDIGDPKIIQKLTENGQIDLLCAGFPCQPFSKAGKQNTSQHVSYDTFNKLLKVISTYNQNPLTKQEKIELLRKVIGEYRCFLCF
jgi:DNA (cytosine-5)-methyltransferase 1